jgi:hypothetical protein
MAITDDNAFELPKLRSSFILENDTEFLENDNVAGMVFSFLLLD